MLSFIIDLFIKDKKYCENCKFFDNWYSSRCKHDKSVYFENNNRFVTNPESYNKTCNKMRGVLGACGPTASLYEEKEKQNNAN